MNLATKTMNAVQPSITDEKAPGTTPSHTQPELEDTVPGAFPDTDDEQGDESIVAKNKTSVGHKQRDSGIDIGQTSRFKELGVDDYTSTTAKEQVGDNGPVAPIGESETTWSESLPIRPASGSDVDKSGNTAAAYSNQADNVSTNRDVDQLESQNSVNAEDGGVSAGPAAWTSTEEVRTQHLGNEGKVIGVADESEEDKRVGNSSDALPHPQTGASSRVGTQEPVVTGSENLDAELDHGHKSLGQYSGTGPSAHQEMQVIDSQTEEPAKPNVDTQSKATWADPSLQAAHQQLQDTPTSSEIPPVESTSGSGSHHFDHEHEDPSLAEARQQLQTNALQSRAPAEASGGIYNGVLGAGSDNLKEVRSGSPHERISDDRKGHVRNKISGVSESGLGQGGIHNGVVGNGSQSEESARRSFSREQ